MTEKAARQLKSPMLAFVFNFALGGFGMAYVLDHWMWALVNFVAYGAVMMSISEDSHKMVVFTINGLIGLIVAHVVNDGIKHEQAMEQGESREP